MKSWNATELSEMMRQYQVPCVLLAACELELFSVLEGGAKDCRSRGRGDPGGSPRHDDTA